MHEDGIAREKNRSFENKNKKKTERETERERGSAGTRSPPWVYVARPDNRAILNIIRAFIAPRPLVIRHSTQQRAMAPRRPTRSFTPRGEPRGKQKSEATLRKHRRDTRRWIDRGKKEGWRDECGGGMGRVWNGRIRARQRYSRKEGRGYQRRSVDRGR